jgi:hypothetical protein|tara:strand:- start:270 stop:434 length:165 start_codon:yes stop_codon:yes gene_type:complete
MNNLSGPDINMQEMLKTEDNKQSKSGNSQKIYSNCVSTHDDVCFLDVEDDPGQN